MPGLLQRLSEKGDLLSWLSAEGRVYYAADADQNDTLTGQTSFADTTPTLLVRVPSGTTLIPLMADLAQDGTVAGGTVTVVMEFDNADRYDSGGTSETVLASRTAGGWGGTCPVTVYSNPTAAAGYGVRVATFVVGQDVAPAEGAPNKVHWTPEAGLDYLVGPATWAIYTYAGATGPTWDWALKFAAFPTDWMT